MPSIRWKIRDCFRRRCTLKILVCLASMFAVYVFLYSKVSTACSYMWYYNFIGTPRKKFLCVNFHGGMTNQMFQYAFGFSMAKKRNMELIVPEDNILTKYFNIYPNTFESLGYNNWSCSCFKVLEDKLDCGYDESLENSPVNTNLFFDGYFQSWKYWIKYETEIRNKFQFKKFIREDADEQFSEILKLRNITFLDGTIVVSVHIRNNDKSDVDQVEFGYQLPPSSYLRNSLNYFRNLYQKLLFIVCTDDLPWAYKVLPEDKDIHIVTERNSAPVDMALCSQGNHTIMTVGSYGWMISWLSGGKTIHYKYPYRKNSLLQNEFSKEYHDHFRPDWIAME